MRLAPITAPLLRYALPTAALLLLGVAGVLIVQTRPDATPVEAAVTPAPAPGGQGGVSGAGVVEPASELIAIGTPVSAVVASVAVAVGERVAAGSVLFTLDTRAAEAELAVREGATRAAERAIASAVVERNRATAELDRYRAIADARAMTAEELSRREFALKAAEALVAQRRRPRPRPPASRRPLAWHCTPCGHRWPPKYCRSGSGPGSSLPPACWLSR